jgi:hypothetical protein
MDCLDHGSRFGSDLTHCHNVVGMVGHTGMPDYIPAGMQEELAGCGKSAGVWLPA